MNIIATAHVPANSRLDQEPTLRLHIAVPLAFLAWAATALLDAGMPLATAAAILGVTETELVDLSVDHLCAKYGAEHLVGRRDRADDDPTAFGEDLAAEGPGALADRCGLGQSDASRVIASVSRMLAEAVDR